MEPGYQVNFCTRCGSPLIDHPFYCSRCGSRVEYDSSEEKHSVRSTSVIIPPASLVEPISSKVQPPKTSFTFSILSFLALVMFIIIANKVYQFMMVWSTFKWEYEHGNLILRFFVVLIKNESSLSENELAASFVKLYIFGYLFFITNCSKCLVSLLSTFVEKTIFPHLINIAFVIEVLSLGILLGVVPFENFVKLTILLAIPNLAGYWLIRGSQKSFNQNKTTYP